MAKDIEKIIDSTVMPEMEYVKTKRRTITIDEVPEVVLPKTKAEMYEEAKERLDQKTSAVSRAYENRKRKTQKRTSTAAPAPEKKVKTVDLESAAAKAVGSASNAARENSVKIKSRAAAVKMTVDEPKWVGSSEEIIPFSWREPLKGDIAKPTKFYKAAVHASRDRALLLPTMRDNRK